MVVKASEPGPAGRTFEGTAIENAWSVIGQLWGEYREMAFVCQTTPRYKKKE